MPTYGVAQHRALTHQQLSGPLQHQGGLLLLGLDRNEPHRWPRHCLADRRRIVRVVLATLEIGLHVARRHQLHRVAKGLQLATPVMGRGTGLDADQARLQAGKEPQQLRPTDALANNHRPGPVDAVSLEYRLRNIETDCDNLAQGRLPQSGALQRNHPMALRCLRVGAVHSIKRVGFVMSSLRPLRPQERRKSGRAGRSEKGQ